MENEKKKVYWAGLIVGCLSIPFFYLVIPQAAALQLTINELRAKPEITWPTKVGLACAIVASLVAGFLGVVIIIRLLSAVFI
ncbi:MULTISPECIES: hypothetical protein [unclassified Actinobaculum]|uniref:hypothetical protein n=1 Tax=unclassified Actinobaculum TaxID=2609299 RepID=UPI000D529CD2|nr:MULTISPECIES: hypothetical protein [unclassified Actinobaculum]AWE42494.1 hypothetical protein DDD63_06730 [Actinobaculum sp. 313]MBE6483728.1 hypothetical protein [Actinomycetaceae bacterium]RTE48719.1 hypothetical protein EKN07_08345 [Actinobaculum sp. 352]